RRGHERTPKPPAGTVLGPGQGMDVRSRGLWASTGRRPSCDRGIPLRGGLLLLLVGEVHYGLPQLLPHFARHRPLRGLGHILVLWETVPATGGPLFPTPFDVGSSSAPFQGGGLV